MIEVAPPSTPLRPFIQTYVHTAIRVHKEVIRPVPARTAQAIEFTLGEPYIVHRNDRPSSETAYPVAVIGPQTYRRVQLQINRSIESFVVVFQPAGMEHLLSVPAVEFTNNHFEASAVFGPAISELASELREAMSFGDRIRVANEFFARRVRDPVQGVEFGAIAREIIRKRGSVRIPDLAERTGLGLRQLERRFTHVIGVSPKLYACIARFEAAIHVRTRSPNTSWTVIAHELGYYDQMHMVHDFRRLSGDSPSSTAAQLQPFVERPALDRDLTEP